MIGDRYEFSGDIRDLLDHQDRRQTEITEFMHPRDEILTILFRDFSDSFREVRIKGFFLSSRSRSCPVSPDLVAIPR